MEPSLENASPQLQTLLRQMLRKEASMRLSATDVLKILDKLAGNQTPILPGSGLHALAKLGAKIAADRALSESSAFAQANRNQQRELKAKEASRILRLEIVLRFIDQIVVASPAVSKTKDSSQISLAKGSLMINARNDVVLSES